MLGQMATAASLEDRVSMERVSLLSQRLQIKQNCLYHSEALSGTYLFEAEKKKCFQKN